jgi:plastocyanin
VTWHWPSGSLGHNVVADDGLNPDGSGALADGEHTYSFTFTTPGTYRYYCANHGGANGIGMSGIVIVGTTQ